MFKGLHYFAAGFKLIFRPGIKRFVFVPLIINIVIFATGLWFGLEWFEQFLECVLPAWLAWAEYILWPLFAISYLLIVFYLFALLANIIAAPFNGLLAEKVELYLCNDTLLQENTSFKKIIKDLPHMMGSEIYKLIYFLLRALPLLILFVIPGINVVAPFVWFAFSAWMLSLEYLDYPLGNHDILFKQTRSLVKTQRIKCLGFGGIISAFTMIPIVNFFVMPVAVAGATAFYVDTFKGTNTK